MDDQRRAPRERSHASWCRCAGWGPKEATGLEAGGGKSSSGQPQASSLPFSAPRPGASHQPPKPCLVSPSPYIQYGLAREAQPWTRRGQTQGAEWFCPASQLALAASAWSPGISLFFWSSQGCTCGTRKGQIRATAASLTTATRGQGSNLRPHGR